jgi:hypothetical protein
MTENLHYTFDLQSSFANYGNEKLAQNSLSFSMTGVLQICLGGEQLWDFESSTEILVVHMGSTFKSFCFYLSLFKSITLNNFPDQVNQESHQYQYRIFHGRN